MRAKAPHLQSIRHPTFVGTFGAEGFVATCCHSQCHHTVSCCFDGVTQAQGFLSRALKAVRDELIDLWILGRRLWRQLWSSVQLLHEGVVASFLKVVLRERVAKAKTQI